MTMPVVINIGWARSASTAFRQNFSRRHPQILAVDRGQPFSEGPLAVVLQYIKSADGSEFERYLPTLRSELAAYEHNHHDRIICVTDEELSIGLLNTSVAPTTIAARCAQLFPRARTLAVVHDQVDAIRSFYALAQRNSHATVVALSDWVRRFFLNPEEGENFCYLFSYMTTCRAYREWQPTQDIFVLPYDRLKRNHTTAYCDIVLWLGISEKACELLPNETVNASPPIPLPTRQMSGGDKAVACAQPALNEYAVGQEAKIRALFEKDNIEPASEFGVTLPTAESLLHCPAEDAEVRNAL